jgi:hypothetical protein
MAEVARGSQGIVTESPASSGADDERRSIAACSNLQHSVVSPFEQVARHRLDDARGDRLGFPVRGDIGLPWKS